MTKRVDRYLKDKSMDHIDHALGRPVYPLNETYRNYFECGETDPNFEDSPHWQRSSIYKGGATYHVTDKGREALNTYLRENQKSLGRPYLVEFGDYTSTVVALTASKAKYCYWLDVADVFSDLTFGEFCKTAKVRVAY